MTPPKSVRPAVQPLEDRLAPADLSAFLTTQHVDLDVGFAGGTWTFRPNDDDNDVSYAPDQALLYVGKDAATTRTGAELGNLDFVGVPVGGTYFRLPPTVDPNLLYLGVAGGGATPGDFDAYNPSVESKGRVAGNSRWLKVRLVEVKHFNPDGTPGTGQFAVFTNELAGPRVFMSTVQDGVANPNAQGLDATDGISADDAVWVTAGGHSHFNYTFSKPGRYEVTVRLSGYTGNDGNNATPNLAGFSESEPTKPLTIYFSVGSVGRFVVDQPDLVVDEAAGTAQVRVNRVGGSDGRVTVNYATANGTAVAGQDYTATSGTLTFNDGETFKVISIPITNDTDEEPAELFTLTLSQPGPTSIAGYTATVEGVPMLGTAVTTTITIPANDVPGPNQPPTVAAVADQTTAEDTPAGVIAFAVGDDQTPAANLTVSATSDNPALVPDLPASFAFGGSGANRTLTVTPAANAFGTANVTITVTDGGGLFATRTFKLTVTPVADTPSVSPATTLEDTQTSSGLVAFRNPADGAEVTHVKVLTVFGGSLFLADGTTAVAAGQFLTFAQAAGLRFTPAPDANDVVGGPFGFTVRAATGPTDAALAGGTATAVVNVTPVNDAPTGTLAGNVSVGENSGPFTRANFLSAVLPGGGADEAAQAVTPTLVAANPSLFAAQPAIDATGTLTFTPAANASGSTQVTVTLTDNGGTADGGQNTRTLTFTVGVAANVPPVAGDDATTVPEDGTVTVNVLANDADADADPLTVSAFTQPANGTVVRDGAGLKYTPTPGFVGTDTFTYTAADGRGGTDDATVTVTVTAVNKPPVATPDAFAVSAGNVVRGNVLANDTDREGVTLSATLSVLPTNGTVELRADGSFTYTPGAGFAGTDTFTYAVTDGTTPVTAVVTITGRSAGTFDRVFDEGDIDIGLGYEDDELEPHIHDEENGAEYEPGEGLFRVNPVAATPRPAGAAFDFLGVPAGATVYRLSQTQVGGLLFLGLGTEEIADGTFAGDEVAVRVAAVDGPGHLSVWDNTVSGPLVKAATADGLTAGDTFVLPTGAHLHYNWGFTAPGLYAVTLVFTGTLADGTEAEPAEATYFFQVVRPNVAPVAADDTFGVSPGNVLRGTVVANDGDGDGDPLTVAVATGPARGTLALNPDGSFTYTPGAGFAGTDSFTYTLTDGVETVTATATITGRPADPGFDAVLADGDVDVGLAYEDGEFEPHVHDEENEAEYEPGEGVFFIRPETLTPRPAGAAFDFLGVPAGGSFYRMSQSPVGGQVYVGFGTEEIGDGVFANDEVTFRVVAVDGPGQFSVWEQSATGPVVLAATADGLTAADAFVRRTGSHTHANLAFTAPGLYAVTFRFTGTLADGTEADPAEATYYFAVAPANAAPVVTAPPAVTTPAGTPVAVPVRVADAEGGPVRVTVAAAGGTVAVGSASGPTVAVEGTVAEVNAALVGLRFTPAAGFSGAAAVTVGVTDGGFLVGAENARTATATIAVTVQSPPPVAPPVEPPVGPPAVEPVAPPVVRPPDVPLPPAVPPRNVVAVGSGSQAAIFTASGLMRVMVEPFGPGYSAGVRVAAADVTGDGIADLIVGAGPGGSAVVQVYDGSTWALVAEFPAFEAGFAGGVFVAAGDLDGDGKAEVVVTPDEGGGPVVAVFSGAGLAAGLGERAERLRYFGIDDPNFRGGARAALGDVNRDGVLDLIVAAGFGGGPRMAIWDGTTVRAGSPGRLVNDFFAFEETLRNGAYPTAGDADGDGFAEVVAGAGPGGAGRVLAFDGRELMAGRLTPVADFFVGDPSDRSGVRVTAADLNGDGLVEVAAGQASGTGGVPVFALGAGGATRVGALPDLDDPTGGPFVG